MPKSKPKPTPVPVRRSVWAGPERDGITFSMLSKFLVCRERFRLRVVEGLKPADRFDHKIEFGQLWHAAEEAHAATDPYGREPWVKAVDDYAVGLGAKYPYNRADIDKWRAVVLTQFPLYVDYWKQHPDVTARTPLLSEQVFDVPYKLPSGRTVRLRGKWDSVDLVGTGKGAGVWLMENKTKSRIDERQLKRQLTFDLQVMTYLVALDEYRKGKRNGIGDAAIPVRGVRYNVVRRTEHRVGQKETVADFCSRVKGIIETSPGEWFMRWNVGILPSDVAAFRRQCLDPVLEQLYDWWQFVSQSGHPWVDLAGEYPGIHWRHPFGVYNVMDEGGVSELDEFMATGSETGLVRDAELFIELKGE